MSKDGFLYSSEKIDVNKKISIVEEKDVALQMIESFKKGYDSLEDGDVLFAAKNFNEADIFPNCVGLPKINPSQFSRSDKLA